MQSWTVIWWDASKRKYIRRFPGDKPSSSGALEFGKQLQARGLKPEIVSGSKAFPPPAKLRIAPEEGMIWCPYCLKWRKFHKKAIAREGVVGPGLWRCPVCTISIKDAYVRMYNQTMIIRLEGIDRPKVISEKKIRSTIKRRR